jgi:hypothetical protein
MRPAFRCNDRTGARSHWINAQGAPPGGYDAELDRPDWRDHLSRTPD